MRQRLDPERPSASLASPFKPGAGPRLLAFDTSTEQLALAVVSPAGVWAHQSAGGALASRTLLPEAHRLLHQAGLALADLDAIAFGCGPGAFTGLRTSCSVAQGLAFGLGCRVLAIDSLMIVAEDAYAQACQAAEALATRDPEAATPAAGALERQAQGISGTVAELGFDVGVAMDARMDEAYVARYRRTHPGWQVLQAPALYTLPALALAWGQDVHQDRPDEADGSRPAPGAIAGSALLAFGPRVAWPAAAQRFDREHHRAAALARLAAQAWADGAAADPALALPLYLRDKVALTTLEREVVRRAALASTAGR